MSLESILESLGMSSEDATFLAHHSDFHHNRKNREELTAVLQSIAKTYDTTAKDIIKAVLKHPPFANLNHARVLREATDVYGAENETAVKAAILKWPQFADYDHTRVVREATDVYGDEKAVKKVVLKWPQFAGLDHARVVREATDVYGDEKAVKKVVLKWPQFAGYDHARVVRERTRLGRLVNMSKEKTIEKILNSPILASYSARRYLAGLDVARALRTEGYVNGEQLLHTFFNYVSKSPYVPGTAKRRISQVENPIKEPPLMTAMRKSLERNKTR